MTKSTTQRWGIFILTAQLLIISLCIYLGPATTFADPTPKVHAPVEYYRTLSGVGTPVRPLGQITQAQAVASDTYCIAYYDNNRITRLVKMAGAAIVFEQLYAYYPTSGKLMRVESRNNRGVRIKEFSDPSTLKRSAPIDEAGYREPGTVEPPPAAPTTQ